MTKESSAEKVNPIKICGIIMPIASTIDYPQNHWSDVLAILSEAIAETEFHPKLVSSDVAVGLIHERIVNNIYSNEIVICDVSSKNPNVMFELGMRLAFDKPTVVIKDELTGYSFDAGVIEHLSYPSSLRFSQIIEFKAELIKRINATYSKSIGDKNYSPFLKSFGKTILPSSINKVEISELSYISDQLKHLTYEVQSIKFEQMQDKENKEQERRLQTRFVGETVFKLLDEIRINKGKALKYDAKLANEIDNKLIELGIDPAYVPVTNYMQMHSQRFK
ncbi:MAG: hypothetical protein EOO43_03280 [Flavobacterium sp.]|nr:MAG: hypothetical protein EOO43_03280 [Flavobacterium sp.]